MVLLFTRGFAAVAAFLPLRAAAQGLFSCEDACWAATNDAEVMFKGGSCSAQAGDCEPCAVAGYFANGAMATQAHDCIACHENAVLDVVFGDCTGYCVKEGLAQNPYSQAVGVTCTPVCDSPDEIDFGGCTKQDMEGADDIQGLPDTNMGSLECEDLCQVSTSDKDIMFKGGNCGAAAGNCAECQTAGYYPSPIWAFESSDCITCPAGYEIDVVHADCTGYCVEVGKATEPLDSSDCVSPCPQDTVAAFEHGMCDTASLMAEKCGSEFEACAGESDCAPCLMSPSYGGRRLQSMWFDADVSSLLNQSQACQRGCTGVLLDVEASIVSSASEECNMVSETARKLLRCMLLDVVAPSLEDALKNLCDGEDFKCPASEQGGSLDVSPSSSSAMPRATTNHQSWLWLLSVIAFGLAVA